MGTSVCGTSCEHRTGQVTRPQDRLESSRRTERHARSTVVDVVLASSMNLYPFQALSRPYSRKECITHLQIEKKTKPNVADCLMQCDCCLRDIQRHCMIKGVDSTVRYSTAPGAVLFSCLASEEKSWIEKKGSHCPPFHCYWETE